MQFPRKTKKPWGSSDELPHGFLNRFSDDVGKGEDVADGGVARAEKNIFTL